MSIQLELVADNVGLRGKRLGSQVGHSTGLYGSGVTGYVWHGRPMATAVEI